MQQLSSEVRALTETLSLDLHSLQLTAVTEEKQQKKT
jgi:stress-induced morphogen